MEKWSRSRFPTSFRQIGKISGIANFCNLLHGDKIWHFQIFSESVQYGSHLFGTDVRSNPVKF